MQFLDRANGSFRCIVDIQIMGGHYARDRGFCLLLPLHNKNRQPTFGCLVSFDLTLCVSVQRTHVCGLAPIRVMRFFSSSTARVRGVFYWARWGAFRARHRGTRRAQCR